MFNFLKRNFFSLNMDAWSDGQTESKLWLCRSLEQLALEEKIKTETIWIYGSWYGTLAYMLLSRERLTIRRIYCFDIDRKSNKIAEKILNRWLCRGWDIQIIFQDCQDIWPNNPLYSTAKPDLIINTSCEHMNGYTWWKNIPPGIHFALQSTDMPHSTHINSPADLKDFKKQITSAEFFLEAQNEFKYPNFEFTRFMLIGKKLPGR